jgi:streptomycin 6-kinase
MIQVPQSFQAFGRWQRESESGGRWLAALPALVADYCGRWNLRVDGQPWHGDNGIAVPVRRDDEPLVLKVSWPDASVEEQASALRLWDGRGTVRLLMADTAAGILLLERLDDQRMLRDLPLPQALPIIGALLRRLAIPAPDDHPYHTTGEMAASLHESLRQHRQHGETPDQPFSSRVLDTAIDLAQQLSTSAATVLVDSDLHYEQVLGSWREPWLVIDPQVLVGDLEYQCAQLLWSRFDEIADVAGLRNSLDTLIAAAQLDPARARAWTILRAVDYCLWGWRSGSPKTPCAASRSSRRFSDVKLTVYPASE